jgi:hypothetical protein
MKELRVLRSWKMAGQEVVGHHSFRMTWMVYLTALLVRHSWKMVLQGFQFRNCCMARMILTGFHTTKMVVTVRHTSVKELHQCFHVQQRELHNSMMEKQEHRNSVKEQKEVLEHRNPKKGHLHRIHHSQLHNSTKVRHHLQIHR